MFLKIKQNMRTWNLDAACRTSVIFCQHSFKLYSGLIYSDISDHFPIFITIAGTSVPLNSPNEIKYRLIDEFRIRKFKCVLKNSLHHIFEGITDAGAAFDKFFDILDTLYNKYFPIVTKIISNKSLRNPWVTETLKTHNR